MGEYQDPPLRLTIQGLRWLSDEWESWTGDTPEFSLHGTDIAGSVAAEVLGALRREAVLRLDMWLLRLVEGRAALDFEAPNWPTETDLASLIKEAEGVAEILRVLRELAPEIVDDDDDDPESEPTPEPEASDRVG